jgi:hypothetical protein
MKGGPDYAEGGRLTGAAARPRMGIAAEGIAAEGIAAEGIAATVAILSGA